MDTSGVVAGEDKAVTMKWKVVMFCDGVGFWCITDVLMTLLQGVRQCKVNPGKDIRDSMDTWEMWCGAFGFDLQAMLVTNYRSLSRQDHMAIWASMRQRTTKFGPGGCC